MSRYLHFSIAFATSLLLSSCGGGTTSEGGIGGTGISSGRVAQVGSVFVNGTHYDTDGAEFSIEGTTYNSVDGLARISVGMTVSVTGSRDDATATGVATHVSYDSLLEGPVYTILNPANNSLNIMGQTVWIDGDTVFKGVGLQALVGDLLVGDHVEVSGYSDGATGIFATRVELKIPALTECEVTGAAASVDTNLSTFQIGGLNIDASGVASSLPAAGDFVEVTGNCPTSGNPLVATQIDNRGSGALGSDGEELEVEGEITRDIDDPTLNQFALMGRVVQVNAGTTYEKGGRADLLSGRIVEVEGTMNGTVLVADEIEFKTEDGEKTELGGNVMGITIASPGAGTLTLLGRQVQVTNSTILEYDEDLENQSTFSLAELETAYNDGDNTNDFIEAYVYIDNGNLIATRIEWEIPYSPADPDAEVEGIIETVGPGSTFTIAGVTVNHAAITLTFTPSVGLEVEVEGNYNSGSGEVDATDVELH